MTCFVRVLVVASGLVGLAGPAAAQATAATGPDDLGRVITTATSSVGRRPVEPTWRASEVDQRVDALPGGRAPRYPDSLRVAGVPGAVTVRFVVDREGRPDMATYAVVSTTHEAFTAAVTTAVPFMKFSPARKDGEAVRQVVQRTFEFNVVR